MRITPAKMAEIYWKNLRRYSYQEIDRLLVVFRDAPLTRQYWQQVKAHIIRH